MDTDHFDRVTKILSTAGTRRGLVHLVAAVPVLGVLLAAVDEEATAERPHERMHRRTQQRIADGTADKTRFAQCRHHLGGFRRGHPTMLGRVNPHDFVYLAARDGRKYRAVQVRKSVLAIPRGGGYSI